MLRNNFLCIFIMFIYEFNIYVYNFTGTQQPIVWVEKHWLSLHNLLFAFLDFMDTENIFPFQHIGILIFKIT
jgi:hypothetical protein